MSHKSRPGPIGTSCLTCKRRHKKCDRTKPACNRCLKGGYECLGYVQNKYAEDAGPTGDNENLPPAPKAIHPSHVPSIPPATSSSTHDAGSPRDYDEPPILSDTLTALGIYGQDAKLRYLLALNVIHTPQHFSNPAAQCDAVTVITGQPPPSTEQETYDTETTPFPPPNITSIAVPQQLISPSDPPQFVLPTLIPHSVPLPPELSGIIEYVRPHVDRLLDATYFRPQGRQIANCRAEFVWRLSTCIFARQAWVIYTKIRDSIIDGTDSANGEIFIRQISEHEQMLSASLDKSLTPYEYRERHDDVLRVFYVKAVIFNAVATYRLMCRLAPTFFRAVYSDPTLWSTEHNPALISIAHLLTSSLYGPAIYMLMDIIASMAYGVPHIVAYDTDTKLFHTEPHPAEWMNCFPGDFLLLLAKINICRDQGSVATDWKDIEMRLATCEPRPRYKPEGLDSGKSVAWLALQETWRQTLLIYLYLAVYGARTDDPRIQSSLRQIFQIVGTIQRQHPPITNVYLFAQYLIAGICSRTEKQRRRVRERLGCVEESRLWIFHSWDVIPVLDHLWLGAGIDGQPVAWNDYVHSRRTMLPLTI